VFILVYTAKDCCAATSVEAQAAAFEHTFGMFSIPSTSTVSLIYVGIVLQFYFSWLTKQNIFDRCMFSLVIMLLDQLTLINIIIFIYKFLS
jgi:hypothetical protein